MSQLDLHSSLEEIIGSNLEIRFKNKGWFSYVNISKCTDHTDLSFPSSLNNLLHHFLNIQSISCTIFYEQYCARKIGFIYILHIYIIFDYIEYQKFGNSIRQKSQFYLNRIFEYICHRNIVII